MSEQRRFATGRTIMALVLREMSTRYGRSPGGYFWAILEPLGGIVVLSMAFSLLVHAPALGNSFVLFYASGFLPFQIYQTVTVTTSRALNFSRPLMGYPSVTWTDALIARVALNGMTSLMVTYLLLAGILTLTDATAVLSFGPLLLALGLAVLVGAAIGTLNCLLIGLFPVWEMIWSIVTRPLFLASGVVFLYEDMPRFVQQILWYNPLIHVVGILRQGLYPMYDPQEVSVPYVVGLSLGVMSLAMVLLQRYHKDILNS